MSLLSPRLIVNNTMITEPCLTWGKTLTRFVKTFKCRENSCLFTNYLIYRIKLKLIRKISLRFTKICWKLKINKSKRTKDLKAFTETINL